MSESPENPTEPEKKARKPRAVKKKTVKVSLKAKPKRKASVKAPVKPKTALKSSEKKTPNTEVFEREKPFFEVPVGVQPVLKIIPVEQPKLEIPLPPMTHSEVRLPSIPAPHQPKPRFEGRPAFNHQRQNYSDRRPNFSKNRHGSERRPEFNHGRPRMDHRSPMGSPRETVSPSRLEAAKALYSIEKGAKIADVLELKRNLKPEDEALLRELVYGCTRQKRLLDYHLKSFCVTSYEKLPVEVKIALRLGVYQPYFLDRIPPHAAVHESVNLARQGGQEKLCGFVNAVLRTAETKKESREIKGDSDIDTLALRYSHPTWMVKRWAKSMTPEQLEQTLTANNLPHPVYLRVSPGSRARVIETLLRQNIRVNETAWPLDTLSLKSHEGGLFSGESFQKGDWIVQDWVPQAMLDLLPLSEGRRVWDVCAAPGGKTIGLAWKIGPTGQVMASDASEDRRKRLIENVNRIGLKQVTVFDHEIKKLSPAQKFDLAWVDVPCSGTGVLSRRADLRWRLIPKDVMEHAGQQKELLVQAQGHLYPQGHLVYSTCSLEKEENQKVIEAFLGDYPEFKTVSLAIPDGHPEILKDELGMIFLPTAEHDGGFISVLSR